MSLIFSGVVICDGDCGREVVLDKFCHTPEFIDVEKSKLQAASSFHADAKTEDTIYGHLCRACFKALNAKQGGKTPKVV